MFVQTEDTPNPTTLKFLPGRDVMGGAEARDFLDAAASKDSPLAEALFQIAGVSSVFFGRDFLSITKDAAFSWEQLKPDILGIIVEHFTADAPLFRAGAAKRLAGKASHKGAVSAEEKQILEILETRIRPAVQQDGGDIVFENYQDGVLDLRLRGACAGCPSASATLKQGVENLLRYYVPEIREVRSVEDGAPS